MAFLFVPLLNGAEGSPPKDNKEAATKRPANTENRTSTIPTTHKEKDEFIISLRQRLYTKRMNLKELRKKLIKLDLENRITKNDARRMKQQIKSDTAKIDRLKQAAAEFEKLYESLLDENRKLRDRDSTLTIELRQEKKRNKK